MEPLPEGVAIHLDCMRVVKQPIECSARAKEIAEERWPFLDRFDVMIVEVCS